MLYTSRTGQITFQKQAGLALLSTNIDITSIVYNDQVIVLACPLCEDGDGELYVYSYVGINKIFTITGSTDDEDDDDIINVRVGESLAL